MFTIYVYVPDTLADWEMGYVMSELNSGRFFKKDGSQVSLKTVSVSKEPVKTMGGMNVVPDCLLKEIVVEKESVLLLPGADTWNDPRHGAIIGKAGELLSCGATVCAICGATVALANAGLLDQRPHTSNGPGFLEMFSPGYRGQSFYVDRPSVADNNLITAGSTGGLLWAKHIIERLCVFQEDTLESWYEYFRTGEAKYFYTLMQTLQAGDQE